MEVSITLDEPSHYVYHPGEEVKGWATLETPHSLPSCQLKMKCSGDASVSWVDTRGKIYHGSEIYGLQEFNVFETTSTKSAPAGKNRYRLSYTLPDDCPPSFEGKLGHIRYTIACYLILGDEKLAKHRPVNINPTSCKNEILVGSDHFVSYAGTVDSVDIKKKLAIGDKKKFLCIPAETVQARVELPKREYRALEQIPFTVTVLNKAESVQVSQVKVLIQREEIAYGATDENSKITRQKDVAVSYETYRRLSLPAGEENEWKGVAGMPAAAIDLQPSKIITLNFTAIFIIEIKDHHQELTIQVPLKVASSTKKG